MTRYEKALAALLEQATETQPRAAMPWVSELSEPVGSPTDAQEARAARIIAEPVGVSVPVGILSRAEQAGWPEYHRPGQCWAYIPAGEAGWRRNITLLAPADGFGKDTLERVNTWLQDYAMGGE